MSRNGTAREHRRHRVCRGARQRYYLSNDDRWVYRTTVLTALDQRSPRAMNETKRKTRVGWWILGAILVIVGVILIPLSPSLYRSFAYGPWQLESGHLETWVVSGAKLRTDAGVVNTHELRIVEFPDGTHQATLQVQDSDVAEPFVIPEDSPVQFDSNGLHMTAGGISVTKDDGIRYRRVKTKRVSWLPGDERLIEFLTKEEFEAYDGKP